MVSLFVSNHFLQKAWSRWKENVKQWGLFYTWLHVPAWCSMASLGITQIHLARRRRSASGYKRQITTSGEPMASRPTIGLPPPAGHRRLATVVPTMSAILKNIRSENTCSSTFKMGTYFLVIA